MGRGCGLCVCVVVRAGVLGWTWVRVCAGVGGSVYVSVRVVVSGVAQQSDKKKI